MSGSAPTTLNSRNTNSTLGTHSPDSTWDIVDTQLHFSRHDISAALFAMDAVGIAAAVIDEFWDTDSEGVKRPGFRLANGASRAVALTAAAAAYENPHRFSYVLRVDHRDPQLDYVVSTVASDPVGRAIRASVFGSNNLATDFRAGLYSPIFDAARGHDVPVFVINPGNPKELAAYAEVYSDVTIILDHIGMPFGQSTVDETVFSDVLALAAYPNVALKWAHAPHLFNAGHYPFPALTQFLRTALDEFGKERIMWASDVSADTSGSTWAELLFSIRENIALSAEERQWILGRTARTLLRWPGPV